jgi:hypothetical protein
LPPQEDIQLSRALDGTRLGRVASASGMHDSGQQKHLAVSEKAKGHSISKSWSEPTRSHLPSHAFLDRSDDDELSDSGASDVATVGKDFFRHRASLPQPTPSPGVENSSESGLLSKTSLGQLLDGLDLSATYLPDLSGPSQDAITFPFEGMFIMISDFPWSGMCLLPPTLHSLDGSSYTLSRLIHRVHWHLHTAVTQDEWNALDNEGKRAVTAEYHRRCKAVGDRDPTSKAKEASQGVKRVDYLLGRCLYRGLIPKSRRTTSFDEWQLLLGNHHDVRPPPPVPPARTTGGILERRPDAVSRATTRDAGPDRRYGVYIPNPPSSPSRKPTATQSSASRLEGLSDFLSGVSAWS